MVWPRSLTSYYSPKHHGSWGRGRSMLANLALPTLAAMAPEGADIEIVDADLQPVDYDTGADLVVLSGFYVNWPLMREIADRFRARGKLVAIGGPFATLSHETVRPHADILFRGEAERTWPRFLEDFARGSWSAEYVETDTVDVTTSPIPRWDLVQVHWYGQLPLQTARGCPYRCDFCDVIVMYGRKVRSKTPDQILAELELLYRRGVRFVMLADDNLTVHRGHAERTLGALRDFNRSVPDPVYFSTQLSIDLAWKPDLMRLAAEAGLTFAYVGIETSNPAALAGAGKQHNLRSDLVRDLRRLNEHGIVVIGGIMSGFDEDSPRIFDQHEAFLSRTGVAVPTCNLLVASEGTPLFDRLRREGRLLGDGNKSAAGDQYFNTNLVPRQMSREDLIAGHRRLVWRLYRPEAFRERFDRLMRSLPRPRRQPRMRFGRAIARAGRLAEPSSLASHFASAGRHLRFWLRPDRWRVAATLLRWAAARPEYLDVIAVHAVIFAQFSEAHRFQGMSRRVEAWTPEGAGAGPESSSRAGGGRELRPA